MAQILLGLTLAVQALFAAPEQGGVNSKTNKTLLLAFYHPWHGVPWGPTQRWQKWDSFRFPGRYDPTKITNGWRRDIATGDYPLIGPYDTSDREVVRWHFRLAKAAGIDGFLCSWWELPGTNNYWAHQYELFEKVWLPVAEEEHFKIGVLDECAHYVQNYDQLLYRITNSLPGYARSPAYLRVKGQPVWFVYQVWEDWLTADMAGKYISEAERQVGDVYWIFDKMKALATTEPPKFALTVPADWMAIKDIDCFGTYSLFGHLRETEPGALAQLYESFARKVRQAGKEVELPILPGHDNTAVNPEPYVVPRKDGEVLQAFCRAVDAAKPEVAVVCSFNEWFEMTQVEPSRDWPEPYRYLKLLAEWRGKKWETPPLPPTESIDPLLRARFSNRAKTGTPP